MKRITRKERYADSLYGNPANVPSQEGRLQAIREIQPDVEARIVAAEEKRDEYKRLLDRIHAIVTGRSGNPTAYVELPTEVERLVSDWHKQWERAVRAEEKLEEIGVTSGK